MTKLQTINSSKVTWFVMEGSNFDEWDKTYCTDGDGILQVVSYKEIPEYNDKRVELLDQLEVVKTWYNVDTEEQLLSVLEEAQNYLAATYNAIFQDSRF